MAETSCTPLTSHGSSKSNKKPSDGRGISDYDWQCSDSCANKKSTHCNPFFDTVGNGTHKKAHIHRLILPVFLLKQMLNAKLLFQDNRNSSSANLLTTRCLLFAGNYIFTFSMKSIFIDITKIQTHILFVTDKFDLRHVY